MTTDARRRAILKQAGMVAAALGCGLIGFDQARAGNDDPVFDSTSMAEVLKAIGGVPLETAQIQLDIPDLAENGAVVPVSILSSLPDTREISILVESNPFPMIVRFVIPMGTEPFVSTRVKLAQSGSVTAVVKAGDQLYFVARDTTVMLGGCGG